jgi:hypothetical protein
MEDLLSSVRRLFCCCDRLEHHASMEKFVVPNKGATAEVLGNWRKTALVVNAARRFRYVANLDNRRALEEERQRRKLKLSMTVIRAAHRFTGKQNSFWHIVAVMSQVAIVKPLWQKKKKKQLCVEIS